MPLQLGQLEIFAELNEIAGPAGRRRLEPQAVTVLELLAREPGRVWSRDELLEAAWPGRIVSDATLTGVISRLRAALAAAGVRDVGIETRSKRGYVLVEAPQSTATAHRMWSAPIAAIIVLMVMVVGVAAYFIRLPQPLQSLDGVRLAFVITASDVVHAEPVIWLQEGREGEIHVGGEHSLKLRVLPRLDATGLIRLQVEASSLSHWTSFDHVIGLDRQHEFALRADDGSDAYQVKFIASLHPGPQLP